VEVHHPLGPPRGPRGEHDHEEIGRGRGRGLGLTALALGQQIVEDDPIGGPDDRPLVPGPNDDDLAQGGQLPPEVGGQGQVIVAAIGGRDDQAARSGEAQDVLELEAR
jgi:hypothetical protein